MRIVGYQGDIVAIWTCSLVGLTLCMGWERVSAFLTLLSLSSGVWLGIANGTDFLSFGICIATLAALTDSIASESVWLTILTSFVAQFRFPTIFLPLVMPAKNSGRAGIFATTVASVSFAAFLLWNPRQMIFDGPLFVLHKTTLWGGGVPHLGTLVLAIVAFFSGGLLFFLWLRRRFTGSFAVLCYMLVLFGVPAILNLALKARADESIIGALGNWEGGMWLLACLPLSAILVVQESSLSTRKRRMPSPAPRDPVSNNW
jgi:hypothetical protein